MDCETYRAWIEQEDLIHSDPILLRQHGETCPECRAWQAQEAVWRQVFATVTERPLTHSLWPGVRARLQERQAPAGSFSAELMALGRLLVPTMALLILSLAGVALWSSSGGQINSQEARLTSSLLMADLSTELDFLRQDADTILQQWGGTETP